MITMFMFSFILLLICCFIMILASIISKKMLTDREKNSPYECGFDPKGSARLPFSLRFFLIAVIFLIFDVEITLLLPVASVFNLSSIFSYLITTILFLIILLAGLYYEWAQGALEWSK